MLGRELPRQIDDNDIAVEIENGQRGTYNVLSHLDYKANSTWMQEVQLTVYGPAAAVIDNHASGAKELALEMFGPACKVASLPVEGLFIADMDADIGNGIPTFWSADREDFAYYDTSEDVWFVTDADDLDEVRDGESWYNSKQPKTAFTCGCRDSDGGVAGFDEHLPCSAVTNENYRHSNIVCRGEEHSIYVQKFCPVTCGACPPGSSNEPQNPHVALQEVDPITPIDPTPINIPTKAARPARMENIDKCNRIPGGTDRNKRSYGGTCKCERTRRGKQAFLSGGCPRGKNFEPRDRYYSKKTMASFTADELANCKCVE